MNGATKFDAFKHSLASLKSGSQVGTGSQVKVNTSNINESAANNTMYFGDNSVSRGALRSAIKFDYELGNVKIASGTMKDVTIQPSANIFSCMDNPNYQRDFEVTPKIIRK